MTALDLWKSNSDDQKIWETFIKSDVAQRGFAVLAELNAPVASGLAGMDGIHEDSKTLQRSEGGRRVLEQLIPSLCHTALRVQNEQQTARVRQADERRMHLNVTAAPGPNYP